MAEKSMTEMYIRLVPHSFRHFLSCFSGYALCQLRLLKPRHKQLTNSRSAKASSEICRPCCTPETKASAHLLTSGGTPDLSSFTSSFSFLLSITVVMIDPDKLTLPLSHPMVHSLLVTVVPKEIENVPMVPDLVHDVASTESTRGRRFCNWFE